MAEVIGINKNSEYNDTLEVASLRPEVIGFINPADLDSIPGISGNGVWYNFDINRVDRTVPEITPVVCDILDQINNKDRSVTKAKIHVRQATTREWLESPEYASARVPHLDLRKKQDHKKFELEPLSYVVVSNYPTIFYQK